MSLEKRTYRVSGRLHWLTSVAIGGYAWIIIYGFVSLITLFITNEFGGGPGIFALILNLIVGPFPAFIIALIIVPIVLGALAIRGPVEVEDVKPLMDSADAKIRVAWGAGAIATLAAFFANTSLFGETHDFSMINVFDAMLTGALVYGTFYRNPFAAFLLFAYFLLIKMPFWPVLQPKAFFWVGIVASLLFWRGFIGTLEFHRLQRIFDKEQSEEKVEES